MLPKKGDVKFENILTNQEATVYNLLNSKKGEIITKDDISREIWKTMDQDKYSEWAIYKLTSNLKQKIMKHNTTKILRVLRGRGYLLESAGE